MKTLYDIEYLNECFTADFENGKLFWNVRPLHHFKNEKTQNIWNKRFAGLECTHKSKGYHIVMINELNFRVHRVLFKMFYNREPKMLDHIDGNRSNNKINNLRECNHSQNRGNSVGCRKGISKGVYQSRNGRWYSRCAGRYLGTFDTYNEAKYTYQNAAAQHFQGFEFFGER